MNSTASAKSVNVSDVFSKANTERRHSSSEVRLGLAALKRQVDQQFFVGRNPLKNDVSSFGKGNLRDGVTRGGGVCSLDKDCGMGVCRADSTCSCTLLYGGPHCDRVLTLSHRVKLLAWQRRFNIDYALDFTLNQAFVLNDKLKHLLVKPTSTAEAASIGDITPALFHVLPEIDALPGNPPKVFQRCALVDHSALLLPFADGAAIDAHDAVLRLGNDPTHGYERIVGSKTTMRICGHAAPCRGESDNEMVFRHLYDDQALQRFTHDHRSNVMTTDSARLYAFQPSFTNYVKRILPFEASPAVTAVLLAMHMCFTVNLYGFVAPTKSSGYSGRPSYWHVTAKRGGGGAGGGEGIEREPATDPREFEVIQLLEKLQGVKLTMTCQKECRWGDDACKQCIAENRWANRTATKHS